MTDVGLGGIRTERSVSKRPIAADVSTGVQREWNRDSRPIAKNIFVDGRQLVTATGWYTLGQKHYEGYYLRVVKMPEATYDWWNGTVAMSSNMHGDQDLQHGTWIEWYQNGNKKTEAHYDRGMEMGRFIWWYENGQKQAEVDYEGGRPNRRLDHLASERPEGIAGRVPSRSVGRRLDALGRRRKADRGPRFPRQYPPAEHDRQPRPPQRQSSADRCK